MSSLIPRLAFLVICAIAGVVPLCEKNASIVQKAVPPWPTTWEGESIWQIALSPREIIFNRNFPGQVAKFTDGRRELILRWVVQGTRQLHSSSDCFRGMGYTVTPHPAVVDVQGAHWSCFVAARADNRFVIRERITDDKRHEWTDVSAWFWSVLLGQTKGPWMAVTVVEKE